MTQGWEPGCQYAIGDVVEYKGHHYKIIQAHRSQSDWAPDVVPALWGRIPDGEHHQEHRNDSQCGQQKPQQAPVQQPQQPQQPVVQQPQQPAVQPPQVVGYGAANEQYHQQQQQYNQQPQQQQNAQGGTNIQVVPANSNDPRKQSQDGFNIGGLHISDDELKIGGGILGTAAAIGVGAFAWDKYNDAKEGKAEQNWGASNFEADAIRRQGQYLEAVKNNSPLPPVNWVLTDGANIPQGALQGGQEADGTPLYIARAFHENSVQIGKASRTLKDGAHISYGGKEIAIPKYEILVGIENAVRWVDGEGDLKNNGQYRLVEGGHESNGTPLYVAQVHYKGSVQPGKVGENLGACFFAYDNDEKKDKHYRFLTYA
ncbi:uncharacterized protein EV422DRAFT_512791 [Fimicolochytrium jonesii]|uniref:uncharacterized protein n=1 Tax=Fimicolochytrium jonesii TaxID=1396493 RepID=UPI0022FEDD91|nr:uncharacterized protein EV422DRAFT_512791 [Fimicolochytrium jonesii]KAI8827136.1 hypothetical protein EV422DRAFT_512791 [Fimicolochytrium jonesii]